VLGSADRQISSLLESCILVCLIGVMCNFLHCFLITVPFRLQERGDAGGEQLGKRLRVLRADGIDRMDSIVTGYDAEWVVCVQMCVCLCVCLPVCLRGSSCGISLQVQDITTHIAHLLICGV